MADNMPLGASFTSSPGLLMYYILTSLAFENSPKRRSLAKVTIMAILWTEEQYIR